VISGFNQSFARESRVGESMPSTTDLRLQGKLYSSEVEDGRRIQKFVLKGFRPLPAK
jgi:hypothetical protein